MPLKMASSRGNSPATAFLLLACLVASAVCSDQFDCKEVECPPEITCPSDSTMRVTYTKFDYDTRNSIDGDNGEIENEKNDHTRRHRSRFIGEPSETTNDHPKPLQKRSLQYKRRESIKIVPGDYISLVPEAVRYHHQMHQHQHKWKRTADELQTKAVDVCCPKQTCVCSGNCELPKCFNSAQVPQQRAEGSDIPGKCCPVYQCVDEPDCSTANGTVTFWLTKCRKCTCLIGQKICRQECDEDPGCFSKNLGKLILDGISWLEDDCTQCKCQNGEPRCQASFCKSLDCPNKIKIEGECCMVCGPDNKTETTTIAPTKLTETTVMSNITVGETLKDVTEYETSTVSSSPTPAPIEAELYESTTKKSTSPTSNSSRSNSPTSTSPIKITSPAPPTKIAITKVSTIPPTAVEVISTTIPSSSFPAKPTPQVVVPTVTVTSKSPPKNLSAPVVVSTSATPPILASTHSAYLDTETESIILYTVIVVLLVICFVFAGLYIREVTKRQTYSSIPNSDSNLSQMPRPKVEESA